MKSNSLKSERIEARVTPEALALVRQAAQLQGRSVSDFVMSAAARVAEETIAEDSVVQLSPEDQRRFVDALLNPEPQSPAMKRAFEHRRRLFGEG